MGDWLVQTQPSVLDWPTRQDRRTRTAEVNECRRISGEDCFLLKVHVPAIEALGDLLDRFLTHGQTTSSLIVAIPVAPRAILANP